MRLEKEKSAANDKLGPDSTKNKTKDKKDGDKEGDDENKDEDGEDKAEGDEVKEEPKKPRYFPPRRIPNPFEKAALE